MYPFHTHSQSLAVVLEGEMEGYLVVLQKELAYNILRHNLASW